MPATRNTSGYASGVAVAIVTQNKDPKALARVKVGFPWHTDPQRSYWARLAVPMAGNKFGTLFLPEVGDEVLVAFERQDIRFPYIIGALWGGASRPPPADVSGKNHHRLIRSRKGHQLLFDDNPSDGAIVLSLDDGKKITIDNAGIRVEDAAGNRIDIQSGSGAVKIEANGKLSLSASEIEIKSSGALALKAAATLTIQGSLVSIN
jgi:uncharacterized protein involved in type VI secretion and phage assembly